MVRNHQTAEVEDAGVAAGAVVVKDVPEHALVARVPGQVETDGRLGRADT
jgi:serine acetyltransferase